MTEPEPTVADQIRTATRSITNLWPLMTPVMRATGGQPVKGTREAPTPAPIGTLSFRRETCEQLAAWAFLIAEAVDTRTGLHGNDAAGLATFIGRYADWLSNHEAGPDAAAELATMAAGCLNIVSPPRAAGVYIGKCPLPTETGTCDGAVRGTSPYGEGSQQIKCARCGTVDTLEAWQSAIYGDPELAQYVTATELAGIIATKTKTLVNVATIRQWVHRGKITRTGLHDPKGRPLYDHALVVQLITDRKLA